MGQARLNYLKLKSTFHDFLDWIGFSEIIEKFLTIGAHLTGSSNSSEEFL